MRNERESGSSMRKWGDCLNKGGKSSLYLYRSWTLFSLSLVVILEFGSSLESVSRSRLYLGVATK
jgi:hypothetical protein